MRKGFSLIELVIAMGLVVIIAAFAISNFSRAKRRQEFVSARSKIVATLSEAQARAVSQDRASAWGVHFENSATPFFALFYGAYSSSSQIGYYRLPQGVAYSTSSLNVGQVKEITFSQLDGRMNGSSSIVIMSLSDANASATIAVGASGALTF